MTQENKTSDTRKKKIIDNFDASINALSYLVSSLEQYDEFDGTIKEVKEVIGDLACSKIKIDREL